MRYKKHGTTAAALIGCGLVMVGMVNADDVGPPEIPITPIRLVLPPASEPYGVYLMVVRVDASAFPLPTPLPSRTPRP